MRRITERFVSEILLHHPAAVRAPVMLKDGCKECEMKKRNLFAELKEGFDSLADERAGKASLPVKEFAAVDEWMRVRS